MGELVERCDFQVVESADDGRLKDVSGRAARMEQPICSIEN